MIKRMDGRIEWVCEHGVGHTVYNPNDWGKWTFSHGCCGCCETSKEYEDQIKAVRYDILENSYRNENEKHFNEKCGLYFDDERLESDIQ